MTSPPPEHSSWTSGWKAYSAEYAAFFDRHPVTHAIYTFCLLFTFWCVFQFFVSPWHSLVRGIALSTSYAAIVTVVAVVVRRRAARKRRAESHGDA